METLTMDIMAAVMLIGGALMFIIGLIRLTFWD